MYLHTHTHTHTHTHIHTHAHRLCQMGCYGIGVSRLLQAVIEHGCFQQQERLVWPPAIAPYYVCIAPLKQANVSHLLTCIYTYLHVVLHSAYPVTGTKTALCLPRLSVCPSALITCAKLRPCFTMQVQPRALWNYSLN